MPIYEYACRSCGERFEYLVRPSSGTADAAITCPSCHGADLERLLSLFAVSSETTAQLHLAHGRKLGQKGRRDKLQADIEETEHHR
jgi:putative FmdB family regulatory protein